jgi:hypothetical protein
VLACDPGSRVFGTLLAANTTTFYESNDARAPNFIRSRLRHVDRLKSLADQTRGGLARHLRRLGARERGRLKRFVTNGHRVMADFLVQNGDVVLWPHLRTQAMSAKRRDDGGPRTLSKMATRVLQQWGHGRFRTQTLASKLRFAPHCAVLDVDERYTSKGVYLGMGRVVFVRAALTRFVFFFPSMQVATSAC